MRILLINQYGPPDTSPTSRLAGDLAEQLTAAGNEVVLLAHNTLASGYRQKYRGGFRLLAEAGAVLSLFWKSLWVGSVDQVVVFSSPPMVLLAGICAGRYHNAPVTHWVLDAYPDVAIALGAGGPSFMQAILRKMVSEAYQNCRQVVAVSDAMQAMLAERYQVESAVIYPWPPELPLNHVPVRWNQVPDGYRVWCYSGNLGQAHEWSVLLDVQQELEKRQARMALVIQGGGAGRAKIKQEAPNRGIQHVYLEDYADEASLVGRLHAVEVRVATLKREMSGLLWPSKWALIDCLPGPHLWIGEKRDLGCGANERVGRFDMEHVPSIADWLQDVAVPRSPLDAAEFKESVDRKRSTSLTHWMRLLLEEKFPQ